MKRTFIAYTDPGHGWLKVPAASIKEVGLKAADFSVYSYIDQGHMFLEEDCDAGKFLDAFARVHGVEAKHTVRTCNGHSRVRYKWSNTPEAARYFVPEIA